MPIMERPNSKAKKIHRQVILQAQAFGGNSGSLEVEEISTEETPDLLKGQENIKNLASR